MKKKYFQVAIDGPVASGKSTVASELAKKTGFLYVYTGAMYRALALAAKEEGVDWNDEKALVDLFLRTEISLKCPTRKENDGRKVTVMLNGRDVSAEILLVEIGEGASIIGQYKKVRQELVKRQQRMSKKTAVVMEGRDIGTRVLPEADLKIFLSANLETRVQRKRKHLASVGQKLTIKEVKKDVTLRDKREMTRKVDPLKPAKDAWVFDTSDLTVKEVVERIMEKIKQQTNENEK
jgi:cytidylate kinase